VEPPRNLEVKWLLGDLPPDFKPIADFRKENGDQIAFVATWFRQWLHRAGYTTGVQVALDGTKVKANAKRPVLTAAKLAQPWEQIDADLTVYCAQLDAQDRRDLLEETAARVHPAANDVEALPPMVEASASLYGHQVGEVLADTGYYNPAEIHRVEAAGTVCAIPPKRSPKSTEAVQFPDDPAHDAYRCSAGQHRVLKHKNKHQRKRVADLYQGIACGGCPLRPHCTTSKRGRTVLRYHDAEWVQAYHRRMRSQGAKAKSRQRSSLVEHVFGTLRYWMGQIPLLLRGEDKVQTEMDLYTTAYNFKRLVTIEGVTWLLENMRQGAWATT